jgi:hypothetical protein
MANGASSRAFSYILYTSGYTSGRESFSPVTLFLFLFRQLCFSLVHPALLLALVLKEDRIQILPPMATGHERGVLRLPFDVKD